MSGVEDDPFQDKDFKTWKARWERRGMEVFGRVGDKMSGNLVDTNLLINKELAKAEIRSKEWLPNKPFEKVSRPLSEWKNNINMVRSISNKAVNHFHQGMKRIQVATSPSWMAKVKVDKLCQEGKEILFMAGVGGEKKRISLNDLVEWDKIRNLKNWSHGPNVDHLSIGWKDLQVLICVILYWHYKLDLNTYALITRKSELDFLSPAKLKSNVVKKLKKKHCS